MKKRAIVLVLLLISSVLAMGIYIQQPSMTVQMIGTYDSPSTANPLVLSKYQAANCIIYQNSAGDIDLPAAATVPGANIIIYNTSGSNVILVDPNASEVIVMDGTPLTGGYKVSQATGIGNYVTLTSDGVKWVTLGYKGTLTDGGA